MFQRLGDVTEIFRDLLDVDVPSALGDAWETLQENIAARHVLTHASGIVDQKYLDQVPASSLQIGQRLVVNRLRVDGLLDAAAAALGTLLAPTPAGGP